MRYLRVLLSRCQDGKKCLGKLVSNLSNWCSLLSLPQDRRAVGALPLLSRPVRGHVPPHVAGAAELGGTLGAGVRFFAVASPTDKVGVVI